MLKLKIGQRALLLFVAVSITPVLFLNTYWLRSQQQVLHKEAERQQVLLTETAAVRTNEFMARKLNALILHAQTTSVLEGKVSESRSELENYIKQDSEIASIVLTNKDGKDVQRLLSGNVSAGNEQSAIQAFNTDTAFRIVTFLGGKEYLSPVTYIENKPFMQIAVPVLVFSKAQDFSQLSTAERGVIRGSNDINGALIIMVDLSNIWNSLFEHDDNTASHSYIVDDKKRLVGRDEVNSGNTDPDYSKVEAVSYFIDHPEAQYNRTIEAVGTNGSRVLTSYAKVPMTNWTVINEEPLANIESAAQSVAQTVWILNVVFALAAVAIGYIFSRRITLPIRHLAEGASDIGAGRFDTRISVSSDDEIGQLGRSLSDMGQKLKSMVERIDSERNQLDVILNSIDEGVFALDRDGNIKIVNRMAILLFNTTEQQLTGHQFRNLAVFRQDLAELIIDVNEIKFGLNNLVEFKDLQFTDTSGRQHFVDVIVARLAHVENDIETIITVIDQTATRELEAMKVDFVSLAAHELRTPLTAIRGYLELTLKDQNPALDDKHRRFLLQANDSSSQLTGLINNLLNVSKIERNALKMSMDKIDWTLMVQNSVQNLQFSAEKAKLTLVYEGPESGVDIIGDSVAIREVIDNLIANAVHYTPENGAVTVQMRTEGDKVITSVHDTGIGIPKSSVGKLFTKFYRVHGGLATGSGGSGLGLYISKSIVELHDGTISVESKEGVGSTFSFTLPLFNQERYQQYQSAPEQKTIRRKHGWITKNSSR
jgi:signal transduction histidine kinase